MLNIPHFMKWAASVWPENKMVLSSGEASKPPGRCKPLCLSGVNFPNLHNGLAFS